MSSGLTGRLHIPYPILSDGDAIPSDIEAVATYCDTNFIPYVQQTSAPLTPATGTFWWCTDTTSLIYGLNYYDGTPWHGVDLVKVYASATAPSVLYPGLLWFNTTTTNAALQEYNGSTWITIIPGTNTNGLSIVSSSGGWVAGSPLDSTKVAKAGDTMTGLLLLSANPSAALGAAPKQYVDSETSRATTAEGLLLPKANNNADFTAPLETVFITGTALAATANVYVSTNGTVILVTA